MRLKRMNRLQNSVRSLALLNIALRFGLCCFFSTPLFAETLQSEGMGQGMVANMAMLAVFAFVFYFMILRPQSKRAKQQRDLITNLQKGDEVITAGGILGKVSRIADGFFVLTIADGIEITVQKQAVASLMPKGTLKNI